MSPATAAQLNGSFVGNGEDTHYYFEWGTDQSYGHTTPAPPGIDAGSGSGPTAASVSLTELTPRTEYHYPRRRRQRRRDHYGQDRRFTTLPAVGQGDDRTRHRRHPHRRPLNGSFVGNGEDTHYYFEWGTDQSYGHTTPALPGTDAGSGSGPTAASVNLSELTPGTEYHYRLVATNAVGTTVGEDREFTSESFVPKLKTEARRRITRTAAQLNGSFVGNGEDTHYYFEWGTDQSYGNTTTAPPGKTPAPQSGPTSMSANLSGLTAQTEYHFRVVAKNADGTTSVRITLHHIARRRRGSKRKRRRMSWREAPSSTAPSSATAKTPTTTSNGEPTRATATRRRCPPGWTPDRGRCRRGQIRT